MVRSIIMGREASCNPDCRRPNVREETQPASAVRGLDTPITSHTPMQTHTHTQTQPHTNHFPLLLSLPFLNVSTLLPSSPLLSFLPNKHTLTRNYNRTNMQTKIDERRQRKREDKMWKRHNGHTQYQTNRLQ